MDNKILITEVSSLCYQQKGFDNRGCMNCDCDDSCCKYGADFDKESYLLVLENKELIESLINKQIEDCFEKEWSGDNDFLGGDSIRSVKDTNGYCIFHNKVGKGCVLYKLIIENNLNRRLIPSICRLFPLTWSNGKLFVYNEMPNSVIPCDCNCLEKCNKTNFSILETQKNKETLDIFEIKISK